MKSKKEKTLTSFKRLLLFSGMFNIILASPLILPFTYQWYLNLFWLINSKLSLGGVAISPVKDGVHALLINTAGIDLVLIGTIVIYSAFDPVKRFGIPLLNAAGRTLFFFVILYYVLKYDIARITLLVGVIDLMISISFIYFYFKLKSLMHYEIDNTERI